LLFDCCSSQTPAHFSQDRQKFRILKSWETANYEPVYLLKTRTSQINSIIIAHESRPFDSLIIIRSSIHEEMFYSLIAVHDEILLGIAVVGFLFFGRSRHMKQVLMMASRSPARRSCSPTFDADVALLGDLTSSERMSSDSARLRLQSG
jgi:hypothetical protein